MKQGIIAYVLINIYVHFVSKPSKSSDGDVYLNKCGS